MKTGDIVKINDGSWSWEVTAKGLKHTFPAAPPEGHLLWRVLETGLKLPADTGCLGEDQVNDTIIQEVANPSRIIFTQERFLRYHTCPTCNQTM